MPQNCANAAALDKYHYEVSTITNKSFYLNLPLPTRLNIFMLTEKLSTFCANSIADFFSFACKETDCVCNIVNVLLTGVFETGHELVINY